MATTPKKITATAAAAGFIPTLVHAYRREPLLAPDPRTGLMVEKAVEVDAHGETVKFQSNENGHIVGLVTTEALFKHLTQKIPEAYIPYGAIVPQGKGVVDESKQEAPAGEFVLRNGADFVVLDTMSDEEVRDFAVNEAGIEADALPEVLTGETLKRAVYNQLKAD